MIPYRRPKRTGSCVYFEVNLAEVGSHLLVDEVDLLRWSIHKTKANHPFDFLEATVLPDRMFAIWQMPSGDKDYGTRWRLIKARFSRNLPKGALSASHVKRQERGIWQRRFWEHHIRDQRDFDTHLQKIWNSPVYFGLTQKPEQWPFSSIHHSSRGKMRVHTHRQELRV